MTRDCLMDRIILKQNRSRLYTTYEDWDRSARYGHPTVDVLEEFNEGSTATLLRTAYHRRVGTLPWSDAEYYGALGSYGKDAPRHRAPKRWHHYVVNEKKERKETARMVQIGDVIPSTTLPRFPCWRKRQYETAEEADTHLQILRSSGHSWDEAALTKYFCEHHRCWHIGHDPLNKERPMSDLAESLSNGGTVTVFLGTGYNIPPQYANHPQIDGIVANVLVPSRASTVIKANTRAVIMTDRIPYQIHNVLTQELKRRRMTCFIRRSDKDLEQALDLIFHHHEEQKEHKEEVMENTPAQEQTAAKKQEEAAATEPARKLIAPRGVIPALVEEYWPQIESMTSSEAGRFIYRIAHERHITTTPLSVEQACRVRRQAGGPTKWAARQNDTVQQPAPTTPEPIPAPVEEPVETKQAKALRLLDNMIGGLQSIREFISTMDTSHSDIEAMRTRNGELEERNRELEEKMRAIKSAFGL